jgi:hypothetical protein
VTQIPALAIVVYVNLHKYSTFLAGTQSFEFVHSVLCMSHFSVRYFYFLFFVTQVQVNKKKNDGPLGAIVN